MKKTTLSMMFAAAITLAMAAPSQAQAQPMKWGHNDNPSVGSYSKMKKNERRMRRQIVKLSQQKNAIQARIKRLKRHAKQMRARGHHRKAMVARRAIQINRTRVGQLTARIRKLQRRLNLRFHRFTSKVTLKNLKRRAVMVEIRMGYSQSCNLNARVATQWLRPGQKLTVRKPAKVVCYRQVTQRSRRLRPAASAWVKYTLPRPGAYNFALSPLRRHVRKPVAWTR